MDPGLQQDRRVASADRQGLQTAHEAGSGNLRLLVTSGSDDLINGIRRYDLWGRLGLLEVKRRYRRTVIGPFWSSFSLGVFVAVMGAVGVNLWKQSATDYVPFLASGMMVWLTISAIITESCSLFISTQHLFTRMRIDYSILACALVWRNLIVFLHNLVVYLAIVLVFATKLVSLSTLYIVPGLLLVSINAVWIALLLGMACVRFRDIQQLVITILQISLFITPVFWPPHLLSGATRSLFVDFNPLYSFIDIIRAPLLGQAPMLWSYEVVFLVTLVGWSLTYLFFSRLRNQIIFWV